MKHDKNISIYPFDKGTGFVVIKEEDAIQKIEEQIGKSKIKEILTAEIPKRTS